MSTDFRLPAWQQSYGKTIPGFHNTYSNGMRQESDIALAAQNLYFFETGWSESGGTSASTPMAAAGQTLVNEALARTYRHFYYGPQAYYMAATKAGLFHPFFDVTQGDNLYYPATKGWDYPTGLGVPNYTDLYLLLATTF